MDSFLDSFCGEDKRDSRDRLNSEVDMTERHCRLAALAFVDIVDLLVESCDEDLHMRDLHTFQVASVSHDDSPIEFSSLDPHSNLHASDDADNMDHLCKTLFLNLHNFSSLQPSVDNFHAQQVQYSSHLTLYSSMLKVLRDIVKVESVVHVDMLQAGSEELN